MEHIAELSLSPCPTLNYIFKVTQYDVCFQVQLKSKPKKKKNRIR